MYINDWLLFLSHPTLLRPHGCNPPGSSVHVFAHSRILECIAISFSSGSFWLRELNLHLLHCRQILYHWGIREEFEWLAFNAKTGIWFFTTSKLLQVNFLDNKYFIKSRVGLIFHQPYNDNQLEWWGEWLHFIWEYLLIFIPIRIQFSHSVVSDICKTLGCSMPGLPANHQLLEFTQTHVHWVSNAIQT